MTGRRLLVTCLLVATGIFAATTGRCVSIHFDGSLGSAGALTGPNFLIPADRGKQVGGNLFHSFGDFNLIKDDVATFQGSAGVQNILARVTGGSASSIDGTLRSEIPGANLYLINPAGVMFGANARLDLSGSFAVTTADYLKLADGGKFNAPLGGDDLFTSAPVSAFGFLAPAPAPVSISGSQLVAPAGRDFTVVAGDLTLDGALVAVPSGRLSLVSARAAGEVPASPDALAASRAAVLPAMGAIELKNGAFANIDGNGGGRVVIRGGRLQVTGGSLVSSDNRGGAAGGPVDVRVTDALVLREGRIVANAGGAGRGGDVAVQARTLSIGGTAFVSGLFAASNSASGARGGDLAVRADDLTLTAGGTISTTTFGLGDGGDVRVAATRLSIDREGSFLQTGIFAAVAPGAIGRGGNIFVESVDAALLGGGVISGDTLGQGDGGNVTVRAAQLRLDAMSSGFFTGITSTVNAAGIGNGGDLIVASEDLTITAGGAIVANTFGRGDGGSIRVTTRTLAIDAGDSNQLTGLLAAVGTGAVGRGGDISVRSESLAIVNGGVIFADTFGQGDGGSIDVFAPQLRIDGQDSGAITGIVADVGLGAVGRGGGVVVHSEDLAIFRGGQISSNTFALGDGGSVRVVADRLRIEQREADSATGIFAGVGSVAQGNGGDLHVRARDLSIIGGGSISADVSGRGKGGTVDVSAQRLLLDGQGLDAITAISSDLNPGAVGSGGDLIIHGDEFTLVGGAVISTDAFGIGDGGRIAVSAGRLFIDGQGTENFTGISSDLAKDGIGNGGNVEIDAGELTLLGGAVISTDTFGVGDGGRVEVSARRLRIDGSGTGSFTGISSDVNEEAIGRGGDIELRADEISLVNQGRVSATTFGRGAAGSVRVVAGDFRIEGELTGVSSSVFPGAIGDGGPVNIAVGKFTLRAGGTITADTLGRGDGGPITVSAGRLGIDGAGSLSFTGLSSGVGAGAIGRGGDLLVTGGEVALVREGRITAATFGRGDAGSVRLRVGYLRIDTSGTRIEGGIFANAEAGSTGRGGSVDIKAGTIALRGNPASTSDGGIIAQSNTSAPAGNVNIRAGRLSLRAGALITSANAATGNAGSIEIAARDAVTLDDASLLTVFSQAGDAGSITLAGRRVELHGGSRVIASAGADGGSITIDARYFFDLDHSTLAATAGTTLTASGRGGTGGNIAVLARITVLDHGTISANADIGRGGNILLVADDFFSSSSTLTATGTTAGTVEIVAPELDLAAGLVILPGALVDASTQLREQCARRLGLDFSSFLVIGRGGVSLAPDEPLAEFGDARKSGEIRAPRGEN